MESVSFTSVAMLCPNPTGKRANRTRWDMSKNGSMTGGKNILAYGCDKYLIFRNVDDPLLSEVYNQNIANPITAVKFSPCGEYLAFGDDKGFARVISR